MILWYMTYVYTIFHIYKIRRYTKLIIYIPLSSSIIVTIALEGLVISKKRPSPVIVIVKFSLDSVSLSLFIVKLRLAVLSPGSKVTVNKSQLPLQT